jgi:hypothetical protein
MIFSGIGIIDSFFSAPPSPIEQCFTSNGTWFCCPGAVCLEVVTIGAGGGGGGGTSRNGGADAFFTIAGQGGGAGGVSVCVFTSSFGSSQCVVIGQGGAGGAACQGGGAVTACPGGLGGTTCFGTLLSAAGGVGGCGGKKQNSPAFNLPASPGGVGNLGTSPSGSSQCSESGSGSPGQSCAGFPGGGGGGFGCFSSTYINATAGGVGSTRCGITLGKGGTGGSNQQTGLAGTVFGGAGGGGGAGVLGGAETAAAGGVGANGIVKVIQYF